MLLVAAAKVPVVVPLTGVDKRGAYLNSRWWVFMLRVVVELSWWCRGAAAGLFPMLGA